MGHDAGDQLLQEIATRYRQACALLMWSVAWEEMEFIILIEEVTGQSDVAIVAHKILSNTIKPVLLLGEECRVTASIGISLYPKDGEDNNL